MKKNMNIITRYKNNNTAYYPNITIFHCTIITALPSTQDHDTSTLLYYQSLKFIALPAIEAL